MVLLVNLELIDWVPGYWLLFISLRYNKLIFTKAYDYIHFYFFVLINYFVTYIIYFEKINYKKL